MTMEVCRYVYDAKVNQPDDLDREKRIKEPILKKITEILSAALKQPIYQRQVVDRASSRAVVVLAFDTKDMGKLFDDEEQIKKEIKNGLDSIFSTLIPPINELRDNKKILPVKLIEKGVNDRNHLKVADENVKELLRALSPTSLEGKIIDIQMPSDKFVTYSIMGLPKNEHEETVIRDRLVQITGWKSKGKNSVVFIRVDEKCEFLSPNKTYTVNVDQAASSDIPSLERGQIEHGKAQIVIKVNTPHFIGCSKAVPTSISSFESIGTKDLFEDDD